MNSRTTISLQPDHNEAIESLRRLSEAVIQLFLAADNQNGPSLLDLDPRKGYVRLGLTELKKSIGFGITHVRGLMVPSGNLQAVVTRQGLDSILTIKDFGRDVIWGQESRGRFSEKRLLFNPGGQVCYKAEIIPAL